MIEYPQDIQDILDKFDTFGIIEHTIPNAIGMWENERACLLWLALNCPEDGNFIEIGSFCGGSAVLLCLAQQHRKLDNTVISVDINFNEFFDMNVYQRGKFQQHKKIQCDSSEFSKHHDNSLISLAFIDGWHSCVQVIKDFEQIYPFLQMDAYIAFHDTSPFIYDEEYREKIRQNTDWDTLFRTGEQDFRLDEAIVFICDTYDYKIVDIPVRDPNDTHFPETQLTKWVRGTTSPFNSLTAIHK